MVTERNWLDVYKWEKWSNKTIPVFMEGHTYDATHLTMTDGRTSAPLASARVTASCCSLAVSWWRREPDRSAHRERSCNVR